MEKMIQHLIAIIRGLEDVIHNHQAKTDANQAKTDANLEFIEKCGQGE
jgi:hypothetical protein